jgi:hypothetical protein
MERVVIDRLIVWSQAATSSSMGVITRLANNGASQV